MLTASLAHLSPYAQPYPRSSSPHLTGVIEIGGVVVPSDEKAVEVIVAQSTGPVSGHAQRRADGQGFRRLIPARSARPDDAHVGRVQALAAERRRGVAWGGAQRNPRSGG